MQGGSEKLSDEAVEETLDKVVRLLAYISDKDLFAEFFRKKLARRLLNSNTASDEHERSILSRLKQQCGAQFTSKVRAGTCGLPSDQQSPLYNPSWCSPLMAEISVPGCSSSHDDSCWLALADGPQAGPVSCRALPLGAGVRLCCTRAEQIPGAGASLPSRPCLTLYSTNLDCTV